MRKLLCIVTGLLLFLMSCSLGPVAGGSTDTELGGPVVSGILYDTNGAPATNTLVKLIPVTHNPIQDDPIPDFLTDTTGADGRYSIQIADSGLYNIEAVQLVNRFRALKTNVAVSGDTVYIDDVSLTVPGAVRITLPDIADTDYGYIFIPGSEFSERLSENAIVSIGSKRFMVFDSLPADTLPGIYYGKEFSVDPIQPLLGTVIITSCDTTGASEIIETWDVINTANSGIPGNDINAVLIDRAGNLWVGTDTKGLAKYDGSAWQVFDSTSAGLGLLHTNRILSLMDGNDGYIWIGTDSGLVRYDGVSWYTTTAIPKYAIVDMALDSTGNRVVVADTEYVKYNDSVWYHKPVKTTKTITGLTSLVIDKQGDMICGSQTGLYVMELPDTVTWKYLQLGLLTEENSYVADLAIDDNNGLWCATNFGVYHYDNTTWQVYDVSRGAIPANTVSAVIVDRNNISWAGLKDKDCIVRLGVFAEIFTGDTVSELKNVGTINNIEVGPDNTLYFATAQGGVVKLTYMLSKYLNR